MTYVTDSMRGALAGHRLTQVCNANGVRVFRMAAPGRFAELWTERMARIEAIVAGWGWEASDMSGVRTCYLGPSSDRSVAAAYTSGHWIAIDVHGTETSGDSDSQEAAKLAARAAVLKQAIEHPELWHCGEVEG